MRIRGAGQMVRGKLCALLALLLAGSAASANEWLTFGHDPERSGWNRDERALSPRTVSGLKLLWQTQLPVAVKDVALASLTSFHRYSLLSIQLDPAGSSHALHHRFADGIRAGDTTFAKRRARETPTFPL